MWRYLNTDELFHYGVKGQQWGHHKPIDQVAQEVMRGNYGNGADRKKKLEKEGYKYDEVQKEVNNKLGVSKKDPDKKEDKKKDNSKDNSSKYSKIVDQVINGKFKNGSMRMSELKKAGYDYDKIQHLVNEKLLGKEKAKAIWDRKHKNDKKKQTSKTMKISKNANIKTIKVLNTK